MEKVQPPKRSLCVNLADEFYESLEAGLLDSVPARVQLHSRSLVKPKTTMLMSFPDDHVKNSVLIASKLGCVQISSMYRLLRLYLQLAGMHPF
jgi:hypothetical protein